MEIQMMEIDKLVTYENNPRKNDDGVDAVANSIKEFGFKVPIVVDKNNVIVAGHTNDIKDLMIGISKDCSSYKLSWEAFMNLRKQIQIKGKQLGVAWGQR